MTAHALVANTALHGEQVQVDPFHLHPAFAQRPEVVVVVARERQRELAHDAPSVQTPSRIAYRVTFSFFRSQLVNR